MRFRRKRAFDAASFQVSRGSARGENLESDVRQDSSGFDKIRVLVRIFERHEHASVAGELHACADLRLQESLAERVVRAHCFAGGTHFGTEKRIHALEASEWEHGFLHRAQPVGERTQLEGFERFAGHDPGRDRRDRDSRRLRDERHSSRRPGVYLQKKHFVVLDRELHIHKSQDFQCSCQHPGLAFDFADDGGIQGMRRD